LGKPIENDIVIGFNPKLVIEALKSFTCENIAIMLNMAKAPMLIEAEDSDLKALVLPVALK
jgi:DNA polymerase III sliding clamp (beta) subunit (PCNA family)